MRGCRVTVKLVSLDWLGCNSKSDSDISLQYWCLNSIFLSSALQVVVIFSKACNILKHNHPMRITWKVYTACWGSVYSSCMKGLFDMRRQFFFSPSPLLDWNTVDSVSSETAPGLSSNLRSHSRKKWVFFCIQIESIFRRKYGIQLLNASDQWRTVLDVSLFLYINVSII